MNYRAPGLQRERHHRHASPWIASLTQSVFAGVLLIVCSVSHSDPYAVLFVLVAILATLCLLIVQTMSSISTIVYFHVKKEHPETANWWRTLVAPALGGLGMVYVIYLMVSNMAAAAGSASGTLFFKMIPWIVGLLFFGSIIVAAVWRKTSPLARQLLQISEVVCLSAGKASRRADNGSSARSLRA